MLEQNVSRFMYSPALSMNAVNGSMMNCKDFNESARNLIKVIIRLLTGCTEENHEETPFRRAKVPAKIRTENFANTGI
jgi:hypothetical protein